MVRLVKILFKLLRPILFRLSMPLCTKFQYRCLKRMGVQFAEVPPRYLSAKIWFDGADYSKIKIGKRVTISSNVRILTHDWALDTILEGFDVPGVKRPLGRLKEVSIGDYCFIGTGSIIMPGATIGACSIVGAGSVVRGTIPPHSVVIGNPAVVLKKSSHEYLLSHLPE